MLISVSFCLTERRRKPTSPVVHEACRAPGPAGAAKLCDYTGLPCLPGLQTIGPPTILSVRRRSCTRSPRGGSTSVARHEQRERPGQDVDLQRHTPVRTPVAAAGRRLFVRLHL